MVYSVIVKMCLLTETPTVVKYIYKLTGIIQFSQNASTKFPLAPRLWCIPFYILYICIYVKSVFSFDTIQFTGIFKFFDISISFASLFLMVALVVTCYSRNDNLKLLLIKIKRINLLPMSHRNKIKRNDWISFILIGLIATNILVFNLFNSVPVECLLQIYIPVAVGSLNHACLNDIMVIICNKFQAINEQLQRKVYCVDIGFSIQRVQELSHLHYELVNLAQQVNKHFEVTTIVGIASWFGLVLNILYYILYVLVNDIHLHVLFFTMFNIATLLFLSLSLFLMVWMLSCTQRTVSKVKDCSVNYRQILGQRSRNLRS